MAEKSVEKTTAEKIRDQVSDRLKAIRDLVAPLVQEEQELVEMAPGETIHFAPYKPEPKAAPAKPQAEKPASAAAPKQRRSRQGGTRADQAVAFIKDNPGASASEVAKGLDIKPNYLYRVLADMEKDGLVKKNGRSYEVSASA